MFFDLIRKNSKRNRKENGIFFASLIVSIIAFYIILSLRNQDVIIFLQTMESNAVNRLLGLIPVLYGFSLFILFFLIYFASKYQFERRSHEFGIYIMMGMKRSRLFLLLLAEDSLSSLISLLAGIPAAIFLSELISLVTAKFVGLGIIGHHFTFSLSAVIITIAGFFLIKFLAFGILTLQFAGKEISELLAGSQEKAQKVPGLRVSLLKLVTGVIMTGTAYFLAIRGASWSSLINMSITALLGVCGTFLVFYGFSAWIEIMLLRNKKNSGLRVFTFRQLQENVIYRTNSLAVSSLLALLALCCFGYGFSSAWSSYSKSGHVIDYTFEGSAEEVSSELSKDAISPYIEDIFEVRTGSLNTFEGRHSLQIDGVLSAIDSQEDSPEKEILLNNFSQYSSLYLISLSGYNHLLEISGEGSLTLKDGQAAMYNGAEFTNAKLTHVLDNALASEPVIEIDEKDYQLCSQTYSTNLVVDRMINISAGLIVTDADFDRLLGYGDYTSYWNATLSKEVTESSGLMQAMMEVNRLLDKTSLQYESYLQNIGRQLFYLTASSYTTIYLSLIFLIISNTVLGVQFLMQQKKTGRRYQTLIHLGCDYERLRLSARSQIKWYFGIPLIIAVISSMFGINSLFTGFLSPSMKGELYELSIISMAMIILLCVVEYFYVAAVMRLSDKHVLEMMQSSRDE